MPLSTVLWRGLAEVDLNGRRVFNRAYIVI